MKTAQIFFLGVLLNSCSLVAQTQEASSNLTGAETVLETPSAPLMMMSFEKKEKPSKQQQNFALNNENRNRELTDSTDPAPALEQRREPHEIPEKQGVETDESMKQVSLTSHHYLNEAEKQIKMAMAIREEISQLRLIDAGATYFKQAEEVRWRSSFTFEKMAKAHESDSKEQLPYFTQTVEHFLLAAEKYEKAFNVVSTSSKAAYCLHQAASSLERAAQNFLEIAEHLKRMQNPFFKRAIENSIENFQLAAKKHENATLAYFGDEDDQREGEHLQQTAEFVQNIADLFKQSAKATRRGNERQAHFLMHSAFEKKENVTKIFKGIEDAQAAASTNKDTSQRTLRLHLSVFHFRQAFSYMQEEEKATIDPEYAAFYDAARRESCAAAEYFCRSANSLREKTEDSLSEQQSEITFSEAADYAARSAQAFKDAGDYYYEALKAEIREKKSVPLWRRACEAKKEAAQNYSRAAIQRAEQHPQEALRLKEVAELEEQDALQLQEKALEVEEEIVKAD